MSKSRAERKYEKCLRDWNDILAIWRLCGNSACQRAGCCRGDARPCANTKSPLLPEGVRIWFAGMLWAKEQELSFDEAIEMVEPSGANQALLAWKRKGARLALNEPQG